MAKKSKKSYLPKIYKTKSGKWQAKIFTGYTPEGKRIYTSFTESDRTVLMYKLSNIKEYRQEKDKDDMTVGEAMDRYIDSKSHVLSPSTIRGYRTIRQNCLKDIINISLRELTNEAVQRAINSDAVNLSPKTVRNAHGLLSASCAMYRPELVFHTSLPAKRSAEIQIPTEEEIKKIMKAAEEVPGMYIPVLLAACCGLRRSEIAALTWDDVDFERETITINKALVVGYNGIVEKGTKTSAGTRSIKLFPLVVNKLKASHGGNMDNQEHIARNPVSITSGWRSVMRRAGTRTFRFHDLRHYLVSVMLSLNIPKSYIADYVGHETENMIDQVYGHIMAEKKTSVQDQMQAYFEKAFRENSPRK